MLDPLTLLVDLLCVYRLTRLVVKDSLLNEVRWWILRRWPSALTTFPDNIVDNQTKIGEMTVGDIEGRTSVYLAEGDDQDEWRAIKTFKVTELIECVYCASIWVAFAVLGLRVWWDWWQYPALALGLAGGVALIFSRWDTE